MKKFAQRARELQQQRRTLDQAAMMAAKETFPAEFQPTHAAAVEPFGSRLARVLPCDWR